MKIRKLSTAKFEKNTYFSEEPELCKDDCTWKPAKERNVNVVS